MSIKSALVVDDSMSARVMLRRMLEQQKVSVQTVNSAEEALEHLRGNKPDLIFMDHVMPGMDGLGCTKAIKTDPSTSMIPVVMYTSKQGDNYAHHVREHGAIGILPKPPTPATLSEVIDLAAQSEATPAEFSAEAAAKAPAPVPPPASRKEVSIETIEHIAKNAAESIVDSAVQSLVTRLVGQELGKVRRELIESFEDISRRAASEAVGANRKDLAVQVQEQIDAGLDELKARLAAMPRTIDPGTLDEVKNMARSVAGHKATEAAQQVARGAAQQVAQRVAEESARAVAQQVAREAAQQMARSTAQQVARDVAHDAAGKTAHHVADRVAQQTATNVARQTAEDVARQAAASAAKQVGVEVQGALETRLAPVALLARTSLVAGILAAVIVYFLK